MTERMYESLSPPSLALSSAYCLVLCLLLDQHFYVSWPVLIVTHSILLCCLFTKHRSGVIPAFTTGYDVINAKMFERPMNRGTAKNKKKGGGKEKKKEEV